MAVSKRQRESTEQQQEAEPEPRYKMFPEECAKCECAATLCQCEEMLERVAVMLARLRFRCQQQD